jgi:hypothetical protein
LNKSVFVRELLPQDLKVEIEHLSRKEAMDVAEFLARVVGRGHARQLDATSRKQWITELQRNRSKSLDAPSWLWSSVVELVALMSPPICSTVADTRSPTPSEFFKLFLLSAALSEWSAALLHRDARPH